ncbi:MAG: NAD-dependent epimerase/dehydratase family protein [Acidimicrobiia bacterium]|nr:NAD-dependent epimerase/dehydratase family protein [Acidimicrobiia bacterium]
MRTYLVTGGAGFIGSSIAIGLKRDVEHARVIALDNLRRRGSELNVPRLRAAGVEFVHGDVRQKEDLEVSPALDCIIECSAEPSVLAGYTSAPSYVIETNLTGALNCLEVARRHGATFIFLSTSRVYPIRALNDLAFREVETRYDLLDEQAAPGASAEGVSEDFPLAGGRSIYGATKLAAEVLVQEYADVYGLRAVVNRCGVVTGPWQMGKEDQGVVAFWVARHVFDSPLAYSGYGGTGKQVRDILHVDDLYRLLQMQMPRLDEISGQVFNVGGGRAVSVSLRELTGLCEQATRRHIDVRPVPETRPGDVRAYLSDCRRIRELTGWTPLVRADAIVDELARWMTDHRAQLQPVMADA